jgi:4-aminobutyrate aminotransferase/(S)-3-amino-2-methylpropionate transaminase
VMPYKEGFGPYPPEVHRLPFANPYRCPTGSDPETCGDSCLTFVLDEMDRIGTGDIAAVILEPIQGEGGIVVPPPGFIKGIADFCANSGIVVVADEIQTGMGRAGRWFAIEHEDVAPDLIVIAKSLGGGLPISAVTGDAELMDAVHLGGLGTTFGGNPVAAAAALAVIDKIEQEELLARSMKLGHTIMTRLREMAAEHAVVGDVRGRGAMRAVELVADRDTKDPLPSELVSATVRRCLENGLILVKAGPGDNVIRLLPPLTIDEGLLDDGLSVLDQAVKEVAPSPGGA